MGALSRGRISLVWLGLALMALAAGYLLSTRLAVSAPTPYRDAQLRAAERMRDCEAALLRVVREEGIEMQPEDINQTGLIGPEFTFLTTTLGHLEAKRSALNPNFAALLVRYFEGAGLRPGDAVAIGTSGSFPGLMLATLCAATELQLDARVIASFGASMYGGTRPELNIAKMTRILREQGLVDCTILATSAGGDDDHGESVLFENAQALIADLAAREGVEFISLPTLEQSIERRLELFGTDVRCFVNVGGAAANSGTSAYTLAFPNGLVKNPPTIPTTKNRGLMYEYAARGVPVINMLNVMGMCMDNGLPYDPSPLPAPGEGGVYAEAAYAKAFLWLGIALAAGCLALGRRRHGKG